MVSFFPFLLMLACEVSFLAAIKALAVSPSGLSLIVHLRDVPLDAPLVASVVVVITAPLIIRGL
jgi:hypothetical protein